MAQDPSVSSFGLQPNVAAGIASLFFWVGGLIILLGKPPQAWVRFVAVQSIVLSVAFFALWLVFFIIAIAIGGFVPTLFVVLGILHLIIRLALVIAWIITTVKAFQGSAYRLPVLAQYADKFSAASATL